MNTIQNTKEWLEQAIPEPTDKDFATQLGVFIEEFGETLSQITLIDPTGQATVADKIGAQNYLANIISQLELLGTDLKQGVWLANIKDRILFLDGCADVVVTAVSSTHTSGMNLPGALAEVNRANFSKFVDGKPVFVGNTRKVAKGPNYTPPQLAEFV